MVLEVGEEVVLEFQEVAVGSQVVVGSQAVGSQVSQAVEVEGQVERWDLFF